VIAVTASKNPRPKTHKKPVVLGNVTATLNAGQSQTLVISLNAVGRRVLAQRQTLKVQLALSQSGQPVSASTVIFKSKPKQKKSGHPLERDEVTQRTRERGR
jgi:hypothetical protein